MPAHDAGAGFVFPGDDNGHMSPAWVGKLIARRLPEGWSAHGLRHAFATRLYHSTRDIFVVQRMLGHANPKTTQGYVLPLPDDLRISLESVGELLPTPVTPPDKAGCATSTTQAASQTTFRVHS